MEADPAASPALTEAPAAMAPRPEKKAATAPSTSHLVSLRHFRFAFEKAAHAPGDATVARQQAAVPGVRPLRRCRPVRSGPRRPPTPSRGHTGRAAFPAASRE